MNAVTIKWLSIATSILVIISFVAGTVPPYHEFTVYDRYIWIIVLGVLAFVQAVLLIWRTNICYICRIWSDFTLQLTGFMFILLSGVFGKMYPPFSWAMGVFPVIGIVFLVIGNTLAKQSRHRMRTHNEHTANKL